MFHSDVDCIGFKSNTDINRMNFYRNLTEPAFSQNTTCPDCWNRHSSTFISKTEKTKTLNETETETETETLNETNT
jgi:hypothetical protein